MTEDLNFVWQGQLVIINREGLLEGCLGLCADVVLLSILSDKDLQSVTILYPGEQTGLGLEWNDGETGYLKVLLLGFGIVVKQSVDKSKQLHDSFILTQVFTSLK